MSIGRTLNIGAAGIQAHSNALSVVGDNIANVSTVGYKGSRAGFEDVLGRSISGGGTLPDQSGAGSRMAHVEQQWTQGALLTTDSATDLAITGDGFFIVEGNANGVDGSFYTRAGDFHVAEDGTLVNPNNLKLQGYMAASDGTLSGTLSDINVTGASLAAQPTANVAMGVQLNAEAPVPALAWDPLNPGSTSNFSTNVTVYDSLSNSHEVTVYFRNNGANAWEWHAMVDGGELTGGTPGVPTEGANGTLAFTTNGELDTDATAATNFDFLNATAGQAITFDFGTSITEGGTGLDSTTQFAGSSAMRALSQDGFSAGVVSGIAVESDGSVYGMFTNGQRRVLAQVALADFASVDGLDRAGQGLWAASDRSGEPHVGQPDAGGRGAIVAGALEQSNVDLGREFVNLINFQRGFQANSKIITTADEVYQELVNLKR